MKLTFWHFVQAAIFLMVAWMLVNSDFKLHPGTPEGYSGVFIFGAAFLAVAFFTFCTMWLRLAPWTTLLRFVEVPGVFFALGYNSDRHGDTIGWSVLGGAILAVVLAEIVRSRLTRRHMVGVGSLKHGANKSVAPGVRVVSSRDVLSPRKPVRPDH